MHVRRVDARWCARNAQGTPPVRVPNGVNRDRLSLILAVLSKHTGVKPFSVNVHTNVVGGMTMRCASRISTLACGYHRVHHPS